MVSREALAERVGGDNTRGGSIFSEQGNLGHPGGTFTLGAALLDGLKTGRNGNGKSGSGGGAGGRQEGGGDAAASFHGLGFVLACR